ncbi:MAG TPA: hypothetical protein VJB60_01860 [Candidatus Peribacterales bacterium]|nr:hypothetical protein [Candidatus Peribacterales bacterium]
MKEWLRQANEKFREAAKGNSGYVIDRLKDMVKGALANGAIEEKEIHDMLAEIQRKLQPHLTPDEFYKLSQEFPTDEEALLDLWEDAGLITKREIMNAVSNATGRAPAAPQNASAPIETREPRKFTTKEEGWKLMAMAIANSMTDIPSSLVRLERDLAQGNKITEQRTSSLNRTIRGIAMAKGNFTEAELDALTPSSPEELKRFVRVANDVIGTERTRRRELPGRPGYDADRQVMVHSKWNAKTGSWDHVRDVPVEPSQTGSRERDNDSLRYHAEWDKHRGNTQAGNEWAKEQQWRKEWAAEGIRPGASESDARFRDHVSRAGGTVNGNSAYIDHTGKDAEYYESTGGGGSKRLSNDPNLRGYMERMGGQKYRTMQQKLGESYIPELTDFVSENLPAVQDDPNYERISRAFDRAMKFWNDNPGRIYGDLAFMRSQIQYMQKRGKFNQLMKGMREKMTLGDIRSLHKESIGSPDGRYFYPGQSIRLTIPAELLPYSEGKDLTVTYEPFTVIGVGADSEMEALMDAGIIIDRKETIAGTYPDGRPRVKGIDVHFTKPGRYVLNGAPVLIGESGREGKKESLKSVAMRTDISFGVARPRLVQILDLDREIVGEFDIRSMKQGVRLVDKNQKFGIMKVSDGKNQFQLEFAKKGIFIIRGVGESGYTVFEGVIADGTNTGGYALEGRAGSPVVQEGGKEIRSFEREAIDEDAYLERAKEVLKTPAAFYRFEEFYLDQNSRFHDEKISESLRGKLREHGKQITGVAAKEKEIEDRFALTIETEIKPERDTVRCVPFSIRSLPVHLDQLNARLSRYPMEFLRKCDAKTIFIADQMEVKGKNDVWNKVGGVQMSGIGIGLNDVSYALDHELLHAADSGDNGVLDDNAAWLTGAYGKDAKEENIYGNTGTDVASGRGGNGRPRGFAEAYGKEGGIDEDQATVADILIRDSGHYNMLMRLGASEPELAAKIKMTKELYKKMSDGLMDDKFWADLAKGTKIDQAYWEKKRKG